LKQLTDGRIKAFGQTKAITAWLAANGCEVKDLQKGTLGRALTRKNLTAPARRVMELRLDGAHAAADKFSTLLAWRNGDGPIRGAFVYHGASTGRWSSLGVQLHNMKRPVESDLAKAVEAVLARDLSAYPRPVEIIGDIARATLCAAPGHRFLIADFSGIESRVTAFLADETWKSEQWKKFDRTGAPEDEPYFINGLAFGFPPDKARTPGKTGDLAFNYMGGPDAYRRFAPDDPADDEIIKRRRDAFRGRHPATCRFWYALDDAAIKAVQNPGKIFAAGKHISFRCVGDFLYMRLPSGRELAYPFPRLITTDRGKLAVVYKDNDKGKWVDCRHGLGAYGGTWTENAVSATARDIFAEAMPRLEAAGYPIVLHIHDEIVVEMPDGDGGLEEFIEIITRAPAWADGLPIAVKARNAPRFCKMERFEIEASPRDEAPVEIDSEIPARTDFGDAENLPAENSHCTAEGDAEVLRENFRAPLLEVKTNNSQYYIHRNERNEP
jgi:DNA polymerase bacteriophage-type